MKILIESPSLNNTEIVKVSLPFLYKWTLVYSQSHCKPVFTMPGIHSWFRQIGGCGMKKLIHACVYRSWPRNASPSWNRPRYTFLLQLWTINCILKKSSHLKHKWMKTEWLKSDELHVYQYTSSGSNFLMNTRIFGF